MADSTCNMALLFSKKTRQNSEKFCFVFPSFRLSKVCVSTYSNDLM